MQEREISFAVPQKRRQDTPEQRERKLRVRRKRKRERLRNRCIFLAICLVVFIAILFGIVKLVLFSVAAIQKIEWPSVEVPSVSSSTQQEGSALFGEVTYDVSSYVYDAEDARLILVNSNLLLSEDYTIELAVADDATGITLASQAAASYRAMASAASAQGITLVLTAGYHDAEAQQELFDTWQAYYINEGYTQEEAYTYAQELVALPYASEHQTGYGVDILSADYETQDVGFADTAAFAWLTRYAAEYGFVLRYPEEKQMITGRAYEPWHWRYVGVENAKAIVTSGLSLEEFIENEGVF